MIIDFQHHYTPRELFPEDPGPSGAAHYDKDGVPSYSFHSLLYDLDEHVAMMDEAGIDVAVLSCAEGMCGELERCRLINDRLKQAEDDYPGRFIGTAHAHPLGGAAAFAELARCATELGYPGVVITSEFGGIGLDSPELDPFWAEASRLGLYVFIHPALKLEHAARFDADDMARSVGREFSLVQAVVRLVNGGVLDRHPELTFQIAHLGGGIAALIGRIRSFQDKAFWGTTGNPRHGRLPADDFDHYLRERLVFDTAGSGGDLGTVRTSLVGLDAARIVFATDYPQEIRRRDKAREFVAGVRALGAEGEAILEGNTGLLIPQPVAVPA